jgi:glycosyltransferase involved in cell wall biosynthesis
LPPKILAIIPTLEDDPTDTVRSILNQTVKVSKIVVVVGSWELYKKMRAADRVTEYVYVRPNFRDPLGKRVATALNQALSTINLKEYEWLLRVDADTLLPRRFLEENLEVNADCVGRAGYAMLLRRESFDKIFNGRFVEVGAEDSYILYKLLSVGHVVKAWKLQPVVKGRKRHEWGYYSVRGVEMYKLGYEPLHVLETMLHDIRNVFTVLGYIIALVKRYKRYEFANWVFKTQLYRLFLRKKRYENLQNYKYRPDVNNVIP